MHDSKDGMRTSYREPLSDLRKYFFSGDWLNAPGTEFREPSICNGSPFPVDLRVRWIERTQQGIDDKRSFFDGEGLSFMYDFGCARHDRSPHFMFRFISVKCTISPADCQSLSEEQ
jgi:hypothetical protein